MVYERQLAKPRETKKIEERRYQQYISSNTSGNELDDNG
jgi:hypothetical protein